jgi:hypothetical protein
LIAALDGEQRDDDRDEDALCDRVLLARPQDAVEERRAIGREPAGVRIAAAHYSRRSQYIFRPSHHSIRVCR